MAEKVNIRDYIDQQVAARLDQAAIETRLRETVESIVMEVLAGQEAGGPPPAPAVIDIGVIRDVVRDELEAAGGTGAGGVSEDQVRAIVAEATPVDSAGGGAAGLGLNELRKLVAEMIEVATGDELDRTRGAGADPEALREMVREELSSRTTGLDPESVRAIVQEELVGVPLGGDGGAGGGVDDPRVRAIVAETLAAEAGALVTRVRESVARVVAEAQRALLEGPELGERLAAVAAGAPAGLDEYQVKTLVAQGFVERLPAEGFDAFVTRDEVAAVVAERVGAGVSTAAAGGGEGVSEGLSEQQVREIVTEALAALGSPGGGLSAGDVRKLVASAIEDAGTPSLEDIRALVAAEIRAAGGGGGGVDEDAVRAIVREAVADLAPDGGAGGMDPDAVRQLVSSEVQAAVAANGGGGGGATVAAGGVSVEQFLNSPAMKEALEDRFRLMQTYIKSDLVPKLVQKALEDKG